MKSFIYSLLLLSAIILPLSSCEIYDYSKNRIEELTPFLNEFIQEHHYSYNNDFFIGYLMGQCEAFNEVKTLIDDLYPN